MEYEHIALVEINEECGGSAVDMWFWDARDKIEGCPSDLRKIIEEGDLSPQLVPEHVADEFGAWAEGLEEWDEECPAVRVMFYWHAARTFCLSAAFVLESGRPNKSKLCNLAEKIFGEATEDAWILDTAKQCTQGKRSMVYTQTFTVRKDAKVNPKEYAKIFEDLLGEFVLRVKDRFEIAEAVTGVTVGSGFRLVDDSIVDPG